MKGPRVLVFVVYFGEFPSYFDLTLKSMKANHLIDWLFVTDQDLNHYSDNLKVSKMGFIEFQFFVQSHFHFPISLEKPYKICDFRPAFGKLFADELTGYDYWGHCDLDVIFGDVFGSLPQAAWSADRVLARGSLSFYRNSLEINSLFEKDIASTPDYQSVFSSDQSFYFDEWHGIVKKFELSKLDVWNDDQYFFDINKNIFRLKTTQGNYSKLLMTTNGRIYMQKINDHTICEGAYVHLQKRKIFLAKGLDASKEITISYNTIHPVGESVGNLFFKFIMICIFYQNRARALFRKFSKK